MKDAVRRGSECLRHVAVPPVGQQSGVSLYMGRLAAVRSRLIVPFMPRPCLMLYVATRIEVDSLCDSWLSVGEAQPVTKHKPMRHRRMKRM